MGVPKFFRFISERYPCLGEVVKEYEIPEYDNFYIDANGIIHNCSHPDDSIQFRITEEEMFKDIFYYLEMLFRIIKPKKLFFIAIDGVAPRAKMNQQRGRRFRTAKEAEKAMEEALKKGEQIPSSDRFDSNCITPGTVFMEKLHRQLQYFIKHKISTDELWQRPKIILSGHNVPGEGEHKIMDYIRYLRSQSDWDPNTRHVLHGLDADLIMLGLCTHEPHFSLLREEVKFGKNQQKKKSAEETKFYLLHMSLMRDYLDLEFQVLKDKLSFEYDIERIIDDWVLMGFLVGNDFIPNLPHFHIANNALHLLYQTYIETLPTLDGYINNFGVLNLERFEKYLKKLALIDFDNFKDVHCNLKYFESKTGKAFPGTGKSENNVADDLDSEVLALAHETDMMLGIDGSESDSTDDETLLEEFTVHKARYYKDQLEYDKVDRETLREQAECYIRAIQWNLYYYYTGCPSWSWYYPHHYSPYVSDIKGFAGLDLKFELSTPFLPFQQLLAVLPAASKSIVPEPFQKLMTSPDSPIINFYPSDFNTDLNGKKNDWEAVVLIPFIDEKSLLSAMQPYYKDLTEEENLRNSVKPMEIYKYTSENLGRCDAPAYFPPIQENHADVTLVSITDIVLKPNQVVKGRLPGTISGAYLGFPHLSGIQFTASLKPMKVKVFEHPSQGDNMILKIAYKKIEDEDEILTIANNLLDKIVFVGWPHIQRGKVTSIVTPNYQYEMTSGKVTKNEVKYVYEADSVELKRKHLMTLGIDLGNVDVVVRVKTVQDKRYDIFEGNTGKLIYLWSDESIPFPYQTTLETAAFLDKDDEVGKVKDLNDIFKVNSKVFLLTPKSYGSFGMVTKTTENGFVEVDIDIKPDLDLTGIMELSEKTDLKYYPGSVAAQRLGLSSHLFSRITGSVFVQNIENEGWRNVGLALKYTKQKEEVIGFTKKEGNMWLYSEKAIALVNNYMAKFPELFEYLEKHTGNDMFFTTDVFPENSKEKLNEIKAWLKEQPHANAERRANDAKLLTCEAIKEIENRIINSELEKPLSNQRIVVHPSELYIPSTYIARAPPDLSVKVHLLDRVISVRRNHFIPLGTRGTIIGCEQTNNNQRDTLYDILFDKPIIGGRCIGCNEARICRLPYQTFIDISYGRRKNIEKSGTSAKARMENFQMKEDWRSPSLRNNLRNDNRMSQSPSNRDNATHHNIGNHKVKQFFDGYINLNKVASPSFFPNNRTSEQQEQKRDSNQVTSPPFFANNRTNNEQQEQKADSEFLEFWKILQNHKTTEEKPLRPQIPEKTLSPTAEPTVVCVEQTNALRKFLKLNDTSSVGNEQPSGDLRPQVPPNQILSSKARTPPNNAIAFSHQLPQGNQAVRSQTTKAGHMSAYTNLVHLCLSKNIPFPSFFYSGVPESDMITCEISFSSADYFYGKVYGDPCTTKEEATENAASKAVKRILQKEDLRRAYMPTGLGYRLQQPNFRHPSPNSRGGMGLLPTPPTQWCSTRKPLLRGPDKEQITGNSSRSSPRNAPLSANQTQAHQKVIPVASSFEGPGVPSCEDRVLNSNSKAEFNTGRGSNQSMPHQNSRQPKSNQHQMGPGRPFVGRSRPRIAANFSVPISNQKQ